VKVLFIGNTDSYLADLALNYDNSALLIHHNNYSQFINESKTITGYTALGDLPKDTNVFCNLLKSADEIHYCPPQSWIEQSYKNDLFKDTNTEQHLVEGFLIYFSQKKKIHGLDHINTTHKTLHINTTRENISQKTLWIAGCSNSKATGVTAEESYGHLLSCSLKMPCINLAQGGTSNQWSADQLLRSDIRQGDIVIWGLTSVERIAYIHNSKVVPLTPSYYLENKDAKNIMHPSQLLSENTLHQSLTAIEQVANFCKKIQATFYCFLTFPTDIRLYKFLLHKEYFMQFDFKFTIAADNSWHHIRQDLGTDNIHPGSNHHLHWHNLILTHLKQQNKI